jgi:SAM-dependent methyltransferase
MTRRIDPSRYDTDKPGFTHYFENYEKFFEPIADGKITLLELGINRGGSLQIWRDYFRNGTVVGLDLSPVHVEDTTGRIHVYQGVQQDTTLLDRIAVERAPAGFDVVIDDCAHIGEFSAISFWRLFERHLKPGGIYVIEDWGTGYWKGWPDGRRYRGRHRFSSFRSRFRPIAERLQSNPRLRKNPLAFRLVHAATNHLVRQKFLSHRYGMVGFVKQLVDECGMGDITNPTYGSPPYRASRIRAMQIFHGQIFIWKAF